MEKKRGEEAKKGDAYIPELLKAMISKQEQERKGERPEQNLERMRNFNDLLEKMKRGTH